MKFEETIQNCFDYYPELFQSRISVLNQLFCTIGNGYEWVNGELVDDEDLPTFNQLDENGKAKQYNIIEEDALFGTKIYALSDKYSYLINFPEDIKEDWLNGIKETFEYILNNYDESKDSEDSYVYRNISKKELIELYHKLFVFKK